MQSGPRELWSETQRPESRPGGAEGRAGGTERARSQDPPRGQRRGREIVHLDCPPSVASTSWQLLPGGCERGHGLSCIEGLSLSPRGEWRQGCGGVRAMHPVRSELSGARSADSDWGRWWLRSSGRTRGWPRTRWTWLSPSAIALLTPHGL